MENQFDQADRSDILLTEQKLTLIERLGIPPVVFAFLSLVLVFILYQIIGGIITLVAFGTQPTDSNIFGYRIATGIGQLIFIFVPTLILARMASFQPASYLRISLPDFRAIFVSLIGIFSLQPMLQVYLMFQEKLPFPEQLQSQLQKFKDMIEQMYKVLVTASSIPELLLVIFVIALIPAVSEELLFRGLVQRSIEKTVTPLRSAIITGIVFGAYHLNPFSFVPLVIIGVYLGFLTMRTGSIWVSIVAHFFNNFLACVVMYFKIDDDYVILGKTSEMSAGFLLLTFWFFGVIFLLSMIYLLKITKPVVKVNTLNEGGLT